MDNLQHIGNATNGYTTLFKDIKENLLNTGVIKHFDVYNSQDVLLMEDDENIESPFATPAVFVSFEDITYDTKVQNVQWGNAILKLRIVDYHLRHYPNAIFDLAAIVQAVVHGMKSKDDVYTSLMRTNGGQNTDFAGLVTFNLFYIVTFLADEAHKPDVEKMVNDYTLNRDYTTSI